MRAINYYLRHHHKGMPKSIQAIEKSSEFQKLLSSYYIPTNQELKNWMNEPYEKNRSYENQLVHETCTGEYVRSKSKAYIYTSLYKNKFLFAMKQN